MCKAGDFVYVRYVEASSSDPEAICIYGFNLRTRALGWLQDAAEGSIRIVVCSSDVTTAPETSATPDPETIVHHFVREPQPCNQVGSGDRNGESASSNCVSTPCPPGISPHHE